MSVAQQLRSAREAQSLTIQYVAEITKIRTDHLRALEDGNFNIFSAPVYIRGFVRTYARMLKLDSSQIGTALDDELGQTEKFKEPPPLVQESNTVLDHLMFLLSKFDWRKGLMGLGTLGVVLMLTLTGFALFHHRHSDPLAGLKPAMYQASSQGETLPLATRR